MSDSVYLVGAENVRQAASTMRSAAEDMNRAATSIQEAFSQHERFLTDWLADFKQALDASGKKRED
jgi:hypothetical protein